ncbi:hypothetical protein E5345_04265 [Propionibacterium sp. NM47_B9-13]|jgi:hypothetical protein|uniref:Lipoprotein n=2 Tax=Cutibacterium modestum TaxID=2559073 RepID=A0AAD1KQ99_9ACTN|nr:hypothetical protein [Cutibacterium modestum]TGY29246.1 hypothetical protein E5345_04265 [Propionibacterium sp. NM47_B9-13]AOH44971.1 hypothetical protein BCB70_02575 [Cutibacterium modestum]EFS75447.1 hypothetical protein HMPREF9621_00292 [Cutibacterium modestum HL037PA2]EFS91216.1 hypothetical protein HMPREF9607_02506 [Cutibacterium modestum HL044PA1]EFT16768.1 hypothetical protein HMPREF9622_00313 [Cutibacterium modestum HL037PA3]
MTTALMKTCLLGMAGVMTVGLVACGSNSSSTNTPAGTTVTRSSTSVTASPTPTKHKQTKAPKHLSQDDFTKAISSKKINNQTFTILDNSQIAAQMNQVTKVIGQAKISPVECGKILKQSIASVTDGEINNIVSAIGSDQSAPTTVTLNTAMSSRQKKAFETEDKQFSKCGHVAMDLQGSKTAMIMKLTPIKGYEDISKKASLYTTVSSSGNGPKMSSYQAYVWLNDDQMIQVAAQDAQTAQSTLKSALNALGIDAK